MAELNTSGEAAGKTKKVRSKKLSSRVDLTAMVDLAFLLITFFMLTTSLTDKRAMDLILPEKGEASGKVDENRTLTVLIYKDDKLRCFMGKLSENQAKEISLDDSREFRREIVARKRQALAYSAAAGHPERGLIVLIKPGKTAKYGNLVNVLDEMAISDVGTFAISDLLPEEANLLGQKI